MGPRAAGLGSQKRAWFNTHEVGAALDMKCVLRLLPGLREPCLMGTIPPRRLQGSRRARLSAAALHRAAAALPPPTQLFLLN